jgi:uncharacterized protein YjbI with pentapeptide repeats
MKLSRLAFALCLLSSAALAQGARQEDARGEALMNEGRFAEAQAAFGRALAVEPNDGRALLLGAESSRREQGLAPEQRTVVDLIGVPLEEQDLSGVSLTGLEIIDAHAPRSHWPKAQLAAIALPRAQLNGADFSGAQISASNLDGIVLDDAQFAGASMQDVSLVRARAPRLKARGATFARVRAIAADFTDSDFQSADFTASDLRAARFGGANFTGASLLNADLRGADLSRANLSSTILTGARVDCATRFPSGFDPDKHLLVPLDLCGGRFSLDYRGKNVAGISFRDLDIRGALFERAQLANSDFRGTNVDGADFTSATGFGPHFTPASAREATLENLQGALNALDGADLRNARISGSQAGELSVTVSPAGPRLEGATLSKVRLVLVHGPELAGQERANAASGLRSLLRAQIDGVTIACAPAPMARAHASAWSDYGEVLSIARRLAASSPGSSLAESCRRSGRN